MKTMRMKPRRKSRGQSLVELAIALTVIMWLLAGAIDLGMGLFAWISLREAAEEGALYGSVRPVVDDGDGVFEGYTTDPSNATVIAQRVCTSSTDPIVLTIPGTNNCDPTRITVNVTTSTVPCAGGWITVDLTYNYRIIMPLTGALIGSQTIPIHASVTNTILRPGCP